MTPLETVTQVRWLLQDVKTPQRYSDALLIGFVNQTLRRMAVLRPDLFAVVAEVPTVDGSVIQSTPDDSVRLMEVLRIVGGNSVLEVERRSMDEMHPAWPNQAAGPCINWMRHVRNPNKFFIYPKAPAGQSLVIEYAQTPKIYAGGEDIVLPEAYISVLIDGTVFLAQSVDDEHVSSNRAQLFQQSFTQALGVSTQARLITDTESSGMEKGDVI